jgi:hypothetical protein
MKIELREWKGAGFILPTLQASPGVEASTGDIRSPDLKYLADQPRSGVGAMGVWKLDPVLDRTWRLWNGGGGSEMGKVLEVRRWKWDFFCMSASAASLQRRPHSRRGL